MVNYEKKIHACSKVFVGVDTFLGKESESKIHDEKKSKVCMHIGAYSYTFKKLVELVVSGA
jgi:hypothetical protein